MPSVTLRPNGTVVGFGPRSLPPGTGGKRGVVAGWSEGSARRLLHALFSVRADQLPDEGCTLTLTLDRDVIAEVFIELRTAYVDWLRKHAQLVTWVVEWTAQGRPHLHLAVYGAALPAVELVLRWLALSDARGMQPEWRAQHAEAVWGAVGWLAYLAKHTARGVGHYQRQGVPPGWERTGRLWGFNGPWPRQDALRAEVTPEFARDLRDALDRYVEARRRTLAIAPPELGAQHAKEYRGISVWIPQEDALVLLAAVIEKHRS